MINVMQKQLLLHKHKPFIIIKQAIMIDKQ